MAKILDTLMRARKPLNSSFNFIAKKHFFKHYTNEKLPNYFNSNLFNNQYLKVSGWKSLFSVITHPKLLFSVITHPKLSSEDYLGLRICGQSYDLVCMSNSRREIYLFNTASREFRRLPRSICPNRKSKSNFLEQDTVGFGYDPKTKDFKVIRIVKILEPPLIFHVEIFELSTYRWREIQTPCPIVLSFGSDHLCHDGVYYFWVKGLYNMNLISFDMSEEIFQIIPHPQSFSMERLIRLEVWNGSIVQFLHPYNDTYGEYFEIWAMEKDEEADGVPWSKLLTIGPVPEVDRVLLFLNSNELLMVRVGGKMISYNINTGELKDLPMECVFGGSSILQSFVFSKSLLMGERRD